MDRAEAGSASGFLIRIVGRAARVRAGSGRAPVDGQLKLPLWIIVGLLPSPLAGEGARTKMRSDHSRRGRGHTFDADRSKQSHYALTRPQGDLEVNRQ